MIIAVVKTPKMLTISRKVDLVAYFQILDASLAERI